MSSPTYVVLRAEMSVPSYAIRGLEPQGSTLLPTPNLTFVSWDDQCMFSSLSEKRSLEIGCVLYLIGKKHMHSLNSP